jgi:uncharacterized protein YutE (UPF0331/DUF86 family)
MSAFSSGDTTTQTSAARLGLKERQLELTKFLMGDDPLGMVLRAHMHIEEELIKFIAARDHPEKDIPRGYARCVELALNLGLREEFRKQLSALGRLRNRFAHRLDATIEKEDAETFDAAHEPGDNVIEYAYQSALTSLMASWLNRRFPTLTRKSALSCTSSRYGLAWLLLWRRPGRDRGRIQRVGLADQDSA